MCRHLVRVGLSSLAAAGMLAWGASAWGQTPAVPEPDPSPAVDTPMATLREGFESSRPSWRKEEVDDVAVEILEHDRSDRAQHDGRRSEHFRFISRGLGSSVYYSLPLPKIPVYEDTEISLYVRSNQAGVQLLARVILPADIDPETKQPSFLSIAGTTYEDVGRWQRLELTDVLTAVERQARILRVRSSRKVDLEGAYIERLVVNLYGGGGEAEIFLDDLTITPVPEPALAAFQQQEGPAPAPNLIRGVSGPAAGDSPATGAVVGDEAAARVQLQGSRLTRDGHDWVPTILDAPGAYLDQALPFGFDVVAVDLAAGGDPEAIRRVVAMGALVMPDLGPGRALGDPIADAVAADPLAALNAATSFPEPSAVAFWLLGTGLGAIADRDRRAAELERVRTLVTALRDQPGGFPRLATGIVADEFSRFAVPGQNLDLMGVAAQNWGTMMAPLDALQYLQQRRDLTALWNLNAPHLAWIDAAAPRAVRAAIWGNDVPPAWGSPRVQPEQVRQAAYLALMAGYRGLGVRADAELTRDGGRAVLYELGLINAEIDLVESFLARAGEGGPTTPLAAYPTPPKRVVSFNTGGPQGSVSRFDDKPPPEVQPLESVRVVSITSKDGRSRLVLLADLAAGSQWQPPQMAYNDVQVVVRGAPASAQAYLLSLGGRRVLETSGQEVGGIRFTLPEFDTAAMVLLTTDLSLAERLERELRSIRPRAVDLAIKQAQLQYEWVASINGRLALDGATAPDADDLLAKAHQTLSSAIEALGRESYEEAWDEARRVGRPLRYLMRQHWEASARALAAAARRSLPDDPRHRPRADGSPPIVPVVVPPVASPPLLAFNTLPQHAIWCDWIGGGTFGTDLLQGSGTFDRATPASLDEAGWTDAGHHPDGADTLIRLVDTHKAGLPPPTVLGPDGRPRPAAGGQVLQLRVAPRAGIDSVAPFLDQPAAAVQSPPVQVRARQMVRIRVKVKLPRKLPPGAGGLIVRDSLGGEPLQYRTTEPMNYFGEVVLYRRAPADGPLTVTLGLAGYGVAFFDDLRIEPLEQYTPPGYAAGTPAFQPGAFYAPGRPTTPPRAAAALPLIPARTAR